MKAARAALVGGALALLGACSSVPGMGDKDEFRTTEVIVPPPPEANGSIYQSGGAYMPLFEDRRPNRVGDLLTIVLNEQVSASKNSSATASRSSGASMTADVVPEGLEDLVKYGFDISGTNDFSGSGGAQANNRLTGTITVTVANVLPNGNLRVVGEKQIVINQGTEFIRFSGIVNPLTVDGDNSVRSTEVADARIEYTGKGYANEAQRMGWLQRFFLNVSPI
ncbi:flagellar basal body L-ring protein FlgH [Mangrovimicrobium sediminis]|uniref:Flagellar L-ring protein n=2 Tax=Mangrovimicrobium sediminis TaxID=2562682 RepID=A0A4Z0M180_9GAMM|nr:flagellar basal body L-ring protein FlgH [Haliea sp. SAOS-164]